MQKFIDDDIGYLHWIDENRTGFVVNSSRYPSSEYLILHCATCWTISTSARTNWTTTGYIKICSLHKTELEQWAQEEVCGDLWACKICNPHLTSNSMADRRSYVAHSTSTYTRRNESCKTKMDSSMENKLERVANLLLIGRDSSETNWWWLSECVGKALNKKRANKFLLGCILDYQMRYEIAWENARRLAEDILGNPDDLWFYIAKFPKSKWMSKRKEYSLHRFPKAHERVWRIATEIVTRYNGDARKIWTGQNPAIVLARLNELRVGEQISRMIVGALRDTKQIDGIGDVKADIHVRRVLGRILTGNMLSEKNATEITQKMNPQNPWLLDLPLFSIGTTYCFASNPCCDDCSLQEECSFCKTIQK